MSFEPILLFFLFRFLRRTLRDFLPDPEWQKILLYAQYAVAALFLLSIIISREEQTALLWDVVLIICIVVSFRVFSFNHVRQALYAIIPLVILSFLINILMILFPDLYNAAHAYFNYSFPAATTWMIALLILSNKQKKVLLKERQTLAEVAERQRIEAERKAELEALVQERTLELTRQKEELHEALLTLKQTQSQLIQKEKMASLGELTAGIAHEIQNPLNFVNNFSEVNTELSAELQEEINHLDLPENDKKALLAIVEDVVRNQQKINYHGRRADSIVKNMLQHSRRNSGQKEPTDINALADEYMRLSYHGLRAKDKTFNATLKTSFDESIEKVNVVPQDLSRVLLNLFSNAFYSVAEKKKMVNSGFEPAVYVSTKRLKNDKIEIRVKDNGLGIPQQSIEKIYQPFYTTKPAGEGTGLGLSLSYDIITKEHKGELKVESKEGEFAEFIIVLPDSAQ